MSEHAKASDCDVDPNTHVCRVCTVYHGEACNQCGERGYHASDCVIPKLTHSDLFLSRLDAAKVQR